MSGPPLGLRIVGFFGALGYAGLGTDPAGRFFMGLAAGYLLCSILGTVFTHDRRPNP